MVLLIFICLIGIATTTKGPILQNRKLKLVEDIFDQCNNDIDCPIGLICDKNTCRKPGPGTIGIIENATSIQRMDCKDKISTKKCKKLKKKGKCQDKKTWKKCMLTCKKCTPVTCDPATTCSGHGTCTEDGSCKCSVGFYGDACSIACNAAQNCSNQGICGPNGACVCDCGFFMEDCSNQKFGMPRDTDEEICLMPNGLLHESYFKVFQEGLPKCNNGKKGKTRKNGCCMDIVVVGAGVAGLTAAGLLSKAGHNVKILEASDRVGGRVQTYRDLANGWEAELGAMRIPKTHYYTLGYAKRYNLTLDKFNNDPWRYNIYFRNLKPDYDLEDLIFFQNEFNVPPKDRHHKPGKIFQKALQKPNEDFQCLSWEEILKKYDKYSLRSWLTEKANLSANTVDYISVFNNIESFLDIGLVTILIDDCLQVDADFVYIRHGMDLLPRAMAENLNIQYNAKVTEIDQSGYKIRVKIDCKGVNCYDIDDHTFEADAIVMAIPAGPSESVEFKPKLSLQKIHALRTTPYAPSTKVVLAFEKPFWADQNGGTGGATLTDLPVQQIYYEMNTHKSGVGVVLASYTWERAAQRQDGMSDDDIFDECVKSLAIIHNYSYDKVNNLLLKGVVKRWDMDENALGAFTSFYPFQYTQIDNYLRKSAGRIYFCGEHTDSPHGWIDAAIKSGVRAAKEITDDNCSKSTKILISTGFPTNSGTKTEVIDLEDSNIICEDLEDFPIEIDGAVGANLASTPIICGGVFNDGSLHSSDKCFEYIEGGWHHFATMIEKRAFAAGIVYNNALHIFGGHDWDTTTTLISSEIVQADGSTTLGPQLPTPNYIHAIASINSTVSIISGGNAYLDDNYTDKTWYFDHVSQEFQPGPNLLQPRLLHSSGTVTDQETKEKIVIKVGGFYIDYLDSTEMLLNGEWVTGPSLPKALSSSTMVELGDNLYVIGGYSSDGSGIQNEIHQLSCISGLCGWTTLTWQLKVARFSLVAIPVDNTFCP